MARQSMMSWHLNYERVYEISVVHRYSVRSCVRGCSRRRDYEQSVLEYVVFEREARESYIFSLFHVSIMSLKLYKNITRIDSNTGNVLLLVRTPASQQFMLVTDIRIGHI